MPVNISERKEDPVMRYARSGRSAILVAGNFNDLTVYNGKLYYNPHLVYQKLYKLGFIVIIYSFSGGLQIFNRNRLPKNILGFINELLGRYGIQEFKTSLNEEGIRVCRGFEQIQLQKQKYPIAWIFDYVEHIAPNPQYGGIADDKIIAAETIHKVVNSPQLRESGNIVITVARDGLYNPLLNDLERVVYHLPDENEIASFAKVVLEKTDAGDKRYAPLSHDLSVETFGRLTKGLKLKDCEDIFLEAKLRNQAADRKLIVKVKQKAILKNSGNTLTLVDTDEGLDQIIGLEVVKKVLREQAELLRQGDPRAARGILLMGKPGTGKTLIAKALAAEAGFALYKYNQVKNMFVGESERLEDLAQKTIKAGAPCVVFMDEIDLTMSNRETSQNLDSGVTNSIEQKRYEFMAQDENRGKILFVAATNHIQNLDPAVISRFSLKIPIPGPTLKEIPLHFRKCQDESTGNNDLNLNDPLIYEAATFIYNKGADGRVIRDIVCSTDFTPSGILNAAKRYTGKAKRNDEICAELQSYEMTEDKGLYPWFFNPAEYNLQWYLDGLVDRLTGDYDKAKSIQLRLQLKNDRI